ncbi:MAG TPA: ELWxxDGT repeat protein, partial [Planctomycetota bacterium]|nr:ELWxxDGT repeat protein [Planctomycetota bacterium]
TTTVAADRAAVDLPATGNGQPLGVVDLSGRVLVGAHDGVVGQELWAGDTDGLEFLGDLAPGPSSAFVSGDPEVLDAVPLNGIRLGGRLLFLAFVGLAASPWSTDGTPGGTQKLQDGTLTGPQFHGASLGDAALFTGRTPGQDYAVYRTDGTPAGTQPLFATGFYAATLYERLGNEAIVGVGGPIGRMWKSDGTLAGTTLFVQFLSPLALGFEAFERVGDTVYFTASHPTIGMELWRTDGTGVGTQLVADLLPGPQGSAPEDLTRVGDALFFTADGGTGRELWRTDGTPSGTVLAAALPGSAAPTKLVALGDRLCFVHGDSLYVYEQGAATLLHTASAPGIGTVRAVGSRRVFFRGGGLDDSGSEVWSSDGTPAGTQRFDDFLPGGLGSSPDEFVLSDGSLFVVATQYFSAGRELFHAHVGATAQSIGTGCAEGGGVPE